MLTRDDLIDLIMGHVAGERASPGRRSDRGRALPPPQPRGRPFLSEYDIKRLLTGGSQELRIPRDAIVSPLALDWLTLRGIKVVPE